MSDIKFMLKFSTKLILFQQIVCPVNTVLGELRSGCAQLLSDFTEIRTCQCILYYSYLAYSYNPQIHHQLYLTSEFFCCVRRLCHYILVKFSNIKLKKKFLLMSKELYACRQSDMAMLINAFGNFTVANTQRLYPRTKCGKVILRVALKIMQLNTAVWRLRKI